MFRQIGEELAVADRGFNLGCDVTLAQFLGDECSQPIESLSSRRGLMEIASV